jgi:hypothetical protein
MSDSWLANWTGCLAGWLANWTGCLAGWLAMDWLAGWPWTGWLAGHGLAGWLAMAALHERLLAGRHVSIRRRRHFQWYGARGV